MRPGSGHLSGPQRKKSISGSRSISGFSVPCISDLVVFCQFRSLSACDITGSPKKVLSGFRTLYRRCTDGKLSWDLVVDHLFHIPSTGCRSEKYFRWGDRRHLGFWGSRNSGTLGVGAVPSNRNMHLGCPSMAFKPPGRHYFRFRLNRGQSFAAKNFSQGHRVHLW